MVKNPKISKKSKKIHLKKNLGEKKISQKKKKKKLSS